MEASKVILSEAERQLITDANIILTKNSSIEKIGSQFAIMADVYRHQTLGLKKIHPAIFDVHPKISKGEKHLGLPWLMLDYPRVFDRSGHLAIRTFFWWGNFFSIQLQVSGMYLPTFTALLPNFLKYESEWLCGFTNDAWDMQLPNENWVPVSNYTSVKADFVLKIAKKIPIEEWENLENILSVLYQQLTTLVGQALSTQPVK
ncbi:MAG: hypothetical protein V4717_21510 [Bacteroidota bacterium]